MNIILYVYELTISIELAVCKMFSHILLSVLCYIAGLACGSYWFCLVVDPLSELVEYH